MKPEIAARMNYMPIDEATADPTGFSMWELLENRFWVVHPEKGIAFYDPDGKGRRISPQCNTIKSIAGHLIPDGHEVRFIPRVWLKHDCKDYA